MNPDLCKSIFARHAVAMIMHDLIQVLSYRNHMHARAWWLASRAGSWISRMVAAHDVQLHSYNVWPAEM